MSPLIPMLLGLALGADPLVEGLQAELERSTRELTLGDSGPPYFVGYDLRDVHHTSVTAALGGVVVRSSAPDRDIGVSVRVGSPELDSANFDDSWSGDGFRRRNTVVGDDPYALRHTAWAQTDLAYKEAIENLARREGARARKASNDEAPCFAPGEPVVFAAEGLPPVPLDALEPVAVRLSEVFLSHPEIEWSRVHATASSGRRIHVDSLGTEVVKPEALVAVRAVARARAPDGTWITDQVDWVVRGVDDLPPVDRMVARTEAMASRLEAWQTTEVAEDDYVGPVLFEGEAAVELVRALVLPALQGTPAKEKAPRGSRVVTLSEDGGSAVRVKRRLLPPGFHVHDDPTANPKLASSYTHDDEGTPAQAIELVRDGVIRTHYSSRTPSKEVTASNGHGRGFGGQLVRGAASHTVLTVDRGQSARKLHKLALTQAAAYELDYYVAIRRIENPHSAAAGDKVLFSFSFGSRAESPVRPPLVAVKVSADGTEQPLRGFSFADVSASLLRDLVAAGTQQHSRTTMVGAPGQSLRWEPGQGLPTTIATPSLLIGEVELTAGGAEGERPPELPSPLAADQPR